MQNKPAQVVILEPHWWIFTGICTSARVVICCHCQVSHSHGRSAACNLSVANDSGKQNITQHGQALQSLQCVELVRACGGTIDSGGRMDTEFLCQDSAP